MRCAQRGLAAFFDRQYQGFVFDAGATLEYLVKYVVANDDPTLLYKESVRRELTLDEQFVLDPLRSKEHPLDYAHQQTVIARLLKRRTINAHDTLRIANDSKHLGGGIALDEATRVRGARNAALHIGVFDRDVDPVAAAFLTVVASMSPALPEGLFGDWRDVATTFHLTSNRDHLAEMEVRLCAAKSWWYFQHRRHRLDALQLDPRHATRACPFCGNGAAIGVADGAHLPPWCVADHERFGTVAILDCMHCGLELYGAQIEAASL